MGKARRAQACSPSLHCALDCVYSVTSRPRLLPLWLGGPVTWNWEQEQPLSPLSWFFQSILITATGKRTKTQGNSILREKTKFSCVLLCPPAPLFDGAFPFKKKTLQINPSNPSDLWPHENIFQNPTLAMHPGLVPHFLFLTVTQPVILI